MRYVGPVIAVLLLGILIGVLANPFSKREPVGERTPVNASTRATTNAESPSADATDEDERVTDANARERRLATEPIRFEEPVLRLGRVAQGSDLRTRARFTVLSDHAEIGSVLAQCGPCVDVVAFPRLPLARDEGGFLELRVDFHRPGPLRTGVDIFLYGRREPVHLPIEAEVEAVERAPWYWIEPESEVDVGTLALGQDVEGLRFRLEWDASTPVEVLSIESRPRWGAALSTSDLRSPGRSGIEVAVALEPFLLSNTRGRIRGEVLVRTSHPELETVKFEYEVVLVSPVSILPRPIELSPLAGSTATLKIANAPGMELSIEDIRLDDPTIEAVLRDDGGPVRVLALTRVKTSNALGPRRLEVVTDHAPHPTFAVPIVSP